ncbi:hypothetical protein Sjap_023642 [Stephania japonica]|uniref:Homeobox-leucine zipper protein n=1 Tax=Stephania japonica TaxID=461633 RepID=A0AAP0HPE7_9MAGN
MNPAGNRFFLSGDAPRRSNMLVLGSLDPIFRSGSLMGMDESSKRRPFFSSPDELMIEEEYYDEQSPDQKKRRLTSEQVYLLEKSFEEENKLEPERKTQLAKKLGLQPRQVAVWFQNRRARWKTKQLEKDYDLLKASYDSLLSNYHAIVKDKEKLKSEVVSLTEKLQTKEWERVGGGIELVVSQKPDSLIPYASGAVMVDDDPDGMLGVHVNVKGEDYLSSPGSGGGGSDVVDEDGPHIMDSGHSYFAVNDYHGCMGHVEGVQSEVDDGQDNFSEVFAAAEQQQNTLGLWVWS